MSRKSGWIVALIAVACASLPAVASAQKLVFVVRHAERADASSGQMQMQADPPLSPAGEERAAKLAAMLKDARVQAIFVTEYRRTQDTAKPLAAKLGQEPRKYAASDTNGLVRELRGRHADDIVLVVGHSNTLPALIKMLGGGDVSIADNEYDSLFIIVPGAGTMTRIHFTP